MLLLFLYISFPFSTNLRREKTISQVLTRTWTHRRKLEFSFPCTSKFSSWVVLLASKSDTNWDNGEKDWQTWTCNFERRFRYRRVVDLKLPNDAGLRALDVVVWENLGLVVVLVLKSKALYWHYFGFGLLTPNLWLHYLPFTKVFFFVTRSSSSDVERFLVPYKNHSFEG